MELNHMVKTQVEAEILVHFFLLTQGGMVADEWHLSAPRGCRYRDHGTWPPSPHPFTHVRMHCLVLPAESLRPACMFHIPYPMLFSPILPGSSVLMMLQTIGINSVCGSGGKGKIRKILPMCSWENHSFSVYHLQGNGNLTEDKWLRKNMAIHWPSIEHIWRGGGSEDKKVSASIHVFNKYL